MSIPLSAPSDNRRGSKHASFSKKTKASSVGSLTPEEYGNAVLGYSKLSTGAGQNHIPLGEFLTTEPTCIEVDHRKTDDRRYVTVIVLDSANDRPRSPTSSPVRRSDEDEVGGEKNSEAEHPRRYHRIMDFALPKQLYEQTRNCTKGQSCMVFINGYMSADWIKHIGARYHVDPEFFCRYLDFRPPDDISNNFSVPALPSSSWHLLELPIFTIGTRIASKGQVKLDKVRLLREEGARAVRNHHHCVARLSSSGMSVGSSMFRSLYILDEIRFVIEQRVSICLQTNGFGRVFNRSDLSDCSSLPSFARRPESHFHPTVRHRHMNALKCHLFESPEAIGSVDSAQCDQFASFLARDYGRTLHPEVMSRDALYSLTEVIDFAASSQMQFCNLIDAKLDTYTALPPKEDVENLPNLRYIKQILYAHQQKVQRLLKAIAIATTCKWPRDQSSRNSRKATVAAQNLEDDFQDILEHTKALHDRTSQAITTLMSSISITESQLARDQAQRVAKLTLLAFLFVPMGFTTSLFGMNVTELANGQLGIKWWAMISFLVVVTSLAVLYMDVVSVYQSFWQLLRKWWRGHEDHDR